MLNAGSAGTSQRPRGVPPTSLIISSRNRPAFLSDVVRSVLAGDEVPAELILVDQSDARHPDLDRVETDRPCVVRYLWTHERGLSRGRNAGIRAASHSVLAFIDDDCLVTPMWLGTLTRELAQGGERTVVTGRVAPGEDETPGAFVPSVIVDEVRHEYTGRISRDVLYPNNMAFFRSAIDEVGYFDQRLGAGAHFPSSEDNDFGFRLLEMGYRILYVPEAVVQHRAWRDQRAYLPLRWAYGRGQGAYYMKHLRRDDRHMIRRLRTDAGRHLRRAPGRFRTQRRQAIGDVVYAIGVLAGAAEWMVRRPGGGES